jgi:hypothetical protein
VFPARSVVGAPSDRSPSLSHGVVVEASILARLLGIRLLRLNAHIDLMPADFRPLAESYPAGQRYSTTSTTEQNPLPRRAGTLADATALLQGASRTLRDVRRERVALD